MQLQMFSISDAIANPQSNFAANTRSILGSGFTVEYRRHLAPTHVDALREMTLGLLLIAFQQSTEEG